MVEQRRVDSHHLVRGRDAHVKHAHPRPALRPDHCVRFDQVRHNAGASGSSPGLFREGCEPAQNNLDPAATERSCGGRQCRSRRSSSRLWYGIADAGDDPTVSRNSPWCTCGSVRRSSSITSAASSPTSRVSASNSRTPTDPLGSAGRAAKPTWLQPVPIHRTPRAFRRRRWPGWFRRRRIAVDLLVTLRRHVARTFRLLVDDDRGLRAAEQVLGGERVGRRHELRGAVLTDLQRRQVAACRMAGCGRPLRMRTRGTKSPGAPPMGATVSAWQFPTEWMRRPWKPGATGRVRCSRR